MFTYPHHLEIAHHKPEEVATSASWTIFVRRGELMFSSASRENNAHRHMNTSDLAGLKCAARSSPNTTLRTWSPIGEEKLRRIHLCTSSGVVTKR
ncbi:hypothetical protein UPYG_G00146570 [Umbra pygmaea]|uniref:Uncharacterized protein n=1 Tax=Umbra pygmaea TaxID=75934 RepID=A0ABD0XCL6_UMBPY